ncbi:MAG TPA: hypothetical protein VGG39_24120 [Polyangiaceae bacterium]|jgi:hypothetical protein
MNRTPVVSPSDEIDLYVRTYTTLLRSTGDVDVRAFEETHAFSALSLHEGALSPVPDVGAFAYAAGRLPLEMPHARRVVLGQSHELFEASGFDVTHWKTVRTRGRRRPLRWDGEGTLAVFIASASDIDDFVPMVTAYQIEWNKMHERLRSGGPSPSRADVASALGLDEAGMGKLVEAFGHDRFDDAVATLAAAPLDLKLRMLAASHSQYQRSAQRWWSGVEPSYVRAIHPRRPPVYFVSSNTHAIANLVGGYARGHVDAIASWARETNPEGLAGDLSDALAAGDEPRVASILHYLLRGWIHADVTGARMNEVRDYEHRAGLSHLSTPGHIDVDAQVISLARIDAACLDPRLRVPGLDALRRSDAIVLNIDYPLGMAAYYLLSRVGQGVGELRGVYVMGKAATLNGRVGDVSLSGLCYDEHSRNTFLFRNAFGASDVAPFLQRGSVFDNQAALTVRSAFLQNRQYMTAFYRQGYTVLEMEAGPFLGAVYELIYPHALPREEIVHLSDKTPFDVGFLHYASDTPYSRTQSLLSKSLSYFGVDSTYACAIAIMRRIFEQEVARLRHV